MDTAATTITQHVTIGTLIIDPASLYQMQQPTSSLSSSFISNMVSVPASNFMTYMYFHLP